MADAKRSRLEVTFGEVNEKNVGQLKLLNSVVFPVHYNDSFYNNLLRAQTPETAELIRLAYYNDILVGAVACRLEPNPDGAGQKLYIMTLGVIAPYRSSGIGSQLLAHILKWVSTRKDITEVYLHVQTSNESALSFYKRHGFQVVGKIEKYYKRIEPPDCFILQLLTTPAAAAPAPAAAAAPAATATK